MMYVYLLSVMNCVSQLIWCGGFLHGERDLGCYAFKREEITLSRQKNGNHLVAELRADNTEFMLGYRAKGFIDKNFVAKEIK